MSVFLILLSITSTALTALFGLIVSAVIGFFIGRHFSNSGEAWKTQFEQKNADYIELDKKFKAEGKHLNRLKQESKNWKHKFENLDQEHTATLKEFEILKKNLGDEVAEKEKLQIELNQLNNAFERLSKEYDELRNKYRADQKDTKAWRMEIERWKTEAEKYRTHYHKADVRIKELHALLQNRKTLEAELDQLRIDYKSQTHLIKQLNKDVKYWEQQHYTTHHELAAMKKNLLSMIEEYKTKYIKKNNEYRELLEKYRNNNTVSSVN